MSQCGVQQYLIESKVESNENNEEEDNEQFYDEEDQRKEEEEALLLKENGENILKEGLPCIVTREAVYTDSFQKE